YTRNLLMKQKEKGKAVLLISNELDELFDMSDMLAVICNGRITQPIPTRDAKMEQIATLMTQSRSQGPVSS
ncbi:MAG: heme ABC transporter ATP-binding protein, partial [Candidatus Bathyarchaeia archaeon]